VEAAHIVCTATTSKEPVFDSRLLRLGTHINAVGGFTPRMREMDDIAMRRIDVLVVDSIKASLAEAGDLIIAIEKGVITMDKIYSELGELIAGVKKGREKPSEITYFKTVGNAVQDVSVAGYVLNKASKMGLGSKIEL
jgi:ornithine cyclodeaminase